MSDDGALIAWTLAGIAVIVSLIAVAKLHPFLALLAGSGVVGFGSGLDAPAVIGGFEKGFGGALGSTGILIALGTMLGKLLAVSGGADRVVDAIVGRAGQRGLPWAMAMIAMIVGIPLFFEVGVVLLLPVVFATARRAQRSVVGVGVPALAGLSVMHGLVAPHPGPLIAINALHADLGRTIAYGLIVAIPTVIVAGPWFGTWIGRRVEPTPPAELEAQLTTGERLAEAPSLAVTLATILLPVALMLARACGELVLATDSSARRALELLGDPVIAMLIAVCVASFTFGYLRGVSRAGVTRLLGDSIGPIAGIVLIIGAGGGFKQLLVDGGIADVIARAAIASQLSPLLVGWSIAVGIRLATGSATVATVTASGLTAPIAAQLPGTNTSLLALAIGSGSLFLSHVNDAGFWMVKEYFGMSLAQTFATWTTMETLISVVSLALILALGAVA